MRGRSQMSSAQSMSLTTPTTETSQAFTMIEITLHSLIMVRSMSHHRGEFVWVYSRQRMAHHYLPLAMLLLNKQLMWPRTITLSINRSSTVIKCEQRLAIMSNIRVHFNLSAPMETKTRIIQVTCPFPHQNLTLITTWPRKLWAINLRMSPAIFNKRWWRRLMIRLIWPKLTSNLKRMDANLRVPNYSEEVNTFD